MKGLTALARVAALAVVLMPIAGSAISRRKASLSGSSPVIAPQPTESGLSVDSKKLAAAAKAVCEAPARVRRREPAGARARTGSAWAV